ncbi:MAG: circularly permuted type 2 ATP-grasp protein [Ilumatobacteraceae bacterium]
MSAPTSSSTLPGYTVQTQGYDEAVGPTGETRPAWSPLSRAIATMSPADVADRQRQADRLVESEGASHLFHDFGDDTSRPWRLDPLPFVIGGTEWAELEQGIVQRVRVLDRLLADIYGEQMLLRKRVVPTSAVFGSPGYLLAAQGSRPLQDRWLTTYAADLVRLSTGEWRVLRDLTDAPSGAGYALVNRNVSAQLLPDVVRDMAPMPLAPFFADMRSALDAIAPAERSSPRTVVLTPGLGHPSYFEHSYLAAHLGYHLAEPGDLVVRKGSVWLRALSGLEPVDVLLRRIEGGSADPLESNRGASGVPGLARAARTRGVGLANALGSAVAGSMALLPSIARVAEALGEQLRLPALQTLWCGNPADRTALLANPRRYVLHDVSGIGLPGPNRSATVFGSQLSQVELGQWRNLIATEPHRVVAQEKLTFATAPTLTADGVQPATIVLRVMAVVGRNGTSVMPGGLARVMGPSVPIVNQTTGFTKDVWVLDDRPDRPLPIVTRSARSMPQVDLRESLSTRAAEAMYWVGRTAERAEAIARATAAALSMLQGDPSLLTAQDGAWRIPVVAALDALSDTVRADGDTAAPDDEFRSAIASALTGARGLPGSLRSLARAASSARQFLSATTWRVLGELGNERTQLDVDVASAFDSGVRRSLDTIIVNLSSLSGLFNESTVRGPAWRFLELGRRVERASGLLGMFEAIVSPANPTMRGSLFDYVLASNESLVAYRRRYRSDAVLDALIDLLVLDDQNPRALAFQLDQIRSQSALLPAREGSKGLADTIALAGAALMSVSWLSADADQLGPNGRRDIIDRFVLDARVPLMDFADRLNHVYFNDPTRMRQRIGHL